MTCIGNLVLHGAAWKAWAPLGSMTGQGFLWRVARLNWLPFLSVSYFFDTECLESAGFSLLSSGGRDVTGPCAQDLAAQANLTTELIVTRTKK